MYSLWVDFRLAREIISLQPELTTRGPRTQIFPFINKLCSIKEFGKDEAGEEQPND